MNERIVVEHATEVQVANLAQSRTLRVTKPQGDQSIVLDLSDRNATFDLSAVADEKMTLVKAGPKLIILFDNQSTVTVDPFFDFSGKPLANLDVELGAGRAVNGEQFAQLFSITEDQSVLRAAGIIPPSGANFHDASVDALPDGLRPLALLQHEGLAARISDADDASSRHSIRDGLSETDDNGSIARRPYDHGVRGRASGLARARQVGGHACRAVILPDHDEGGHDQFQFARWGDENRVGRP